MSTEDMIDRIANMTHDEIYNEFVETLKELVGRLNRNEMSPEEVKEFLSVVKKVRKDVEGEIARQASLDSALL